MLGKGRGRERERESEGRGDYFAIIAQNFPSFMKERLWEYNSSL